MRKKNECERLLLFHLVLKEQTIASNEERDDMNKMYGVIQGVSVRGRLSLGLSFFFGKTNQGRRLGPQGGKARRNRAVKPNENERPEREHIQKERLPKWVEL